jgi:hypothetical protein
MLHGGRSMARSLVLCAVLLPACAHVAAEEEALNDPAVLQPVDGSEVSRITLTQRAEDRVAIEVVPVVDTPSGRVIPYAAVFYTSSGETWTYTSPERLTFVRVPITVDHIQGDRAFLSQGPPSGMNVVIQGAAELYGTETDVEE